MFDLINGIPLHPLVVHAVVVLLPLAMLGTIAIAVRPRWRATYGPLVVGAALVATILCPVATSSGEALEKRVGDPGEHADLGESLVWFGLALVILSAALVYLQRRHDKAVTADASAATAKNTMLTVVAVLAVVAGLATTVQVYRVGDSGARAAWGDAVTSSTGD
ncbi:hypothetical protein NPS01_29810 [Nocardioides psychrotolerans]|uniref:DUF2231 domain-containing protein n=1 Tax=Nocardioides psychrotolerans TaxID=1005945 RepID=A0A1I3GJ66_9ACTN|nr:DUF2231 domain-containing protein [Nocardioides psychrotolerans]GEP39318.1 hypothetical protein NPS01_29810 [Nocardioides psychrotolerans]SFI23536.1 hypothetical protein SAMN05216561_106159 [Nocardioides psychrotolerans]